MNWVLKQTKTHALDDNILKNLNLWRTGEKIPTFNQVEALSRATNIPLGYFFLKAPPKEDISLLDYRTIDSVELQNPSRNLVDTIHDMENIQEWMKNHLIRQDTAKLNFVGSEKHSANSHDIADKMREKLNLSTQWFTKVHDTWDAFKHIRRQAESLGILVMMNGIVGNNTHRKLEISEFRAFTLVDDYAPLIFINTNDSYNAKLFSLIHEMAHIWIGESSFFNDRYGAAKNVNQLEILCNEISGEFLVPQVLFLKQWNQQPTEAGIDERINSLSSYFKCGTTVIARRALINDLITINQYEIIASEAVRLYNDKQKEKKEKEQGGDYYSSMATRIDGRFLKALSNSVQEGSTLFTDAFKLTHTNRTTFFALVEKVRGEKP
jgi:Predicted Zn peptidase